MPLLSHKEIPIDEQVLIVLLLQKLKGFGDMKKSIPKPKIKKDISRRDRREESVSAVCLMPAQN